MVRLPGLLPLSSSRASPPRYTLIDEEEYDSKPPSRAPTPQSLSLMQNMASVGHSMRFLLISIICLIAFFLLRFMAAHERVAEQYRMTRRKRELTHLLEAQRRRPGGPLGPPPPRGEPANGRQADSRRPQEKEPELPGLEFQEYDKEPEPARVTPKKEDDAPAMSTPPKGTARVFGSAFETYWDKQNNNRIICRVHQSCLRKNGTLIVPPWLSGFDTTFKMCGVTSVEVMPSLTFWNASGPLGDHDLFTIIKGEEVRPMRGHIPHMATDVLAHIIAQEVIRPTFTGNRSRHYRCRGDACSRRLAREPIRPAVWADDAIADKPASAWQPQVFSRLTGKPALANMRRAFGGREVACFHSVVTHSPTYIRRGRSHWLGEKSGLKAFVNRRSARRRNVRGQGLCRVSVVLLNREGAHRHVGFPVGREIVNGRSLMDEVRKAAGQMRGVRVNMSEVFFEDAAFDRQVATMQAADVVVGAHGAGLGNIMFLREQVPLVEVFPFGYYPGPFFVMAEALYLPYRSVVARPDTDTFMKCIRKHHERGKFPGLMEYAERMWGLAGEKWKKGRERALFAHLLEGPLAGPMRFCARIQMLEVDAPYTAKIVMHEVERVCGLRKPFTPQK